MTLSTGEITVSQKLAEAGKFQMEGQAVRMLDIPVGDQAFGVFDQLHDAPDGRSFSDRLRTNAAEHYGTAGPALVEGFLADRTAAMEKLAASIAAFHAEAERLGHAQKNGTPSRATNPEPEVRISSRPCRQKRLTDQRPDTFTQAGASPTKTFQ